MSRSKIAVERLVWSCILLACAVWLYRLLVSGDSLAYVHPKMHGFMIGAAVGFLMLAVTGFAGALRPGHSSRRRVPWAGYSLFLVPLLLSMAAGPQVLGANAATMRLIRTDATPFGAGSTFEERVESAIEAFIAPGGPDRELFVDDSLYTEIARDMLANPSRYEDMNLAFIGFVHRTPGLEGDRVFITRMLVTCCAADAEPVGILATWTGADDVPGGTWMRVSGRMTTTRYRNPYTGKESDTAMMRVETIVPDARPASEYLYPDQL